jgi:uncharacterized protein
MIEPKFIEGIAKELRKSATQVERTVVLLDDGATLPFIARYRKDITGNLDEVAIEHIAERNGYFVDLTTRREAILQSIEKQNKLTDTLRDQIIACVDKVSLEDIYLPYKPKRKSRAADARALGLEPLVERLWTEQPDNAAAVAIAGEYVGEGKAADVDAALQGAQYILIERFSQAPALRHTLRERMQKDGHIEALPTKNADGKKTKYENYYDHKESAATIPSHRYLAITRGSKEGFLRVALTIDDATALDALASVAKTEVGATLGTLLRACLEQAYNAHMRPSIENEVMSEVATRAEEEAIHVFRENAHSLLLGAPAGAISVIGLDPGLRSGCKLAVVDATGAFVEHATIHPLAPRNQIEEAAKTLNDMLDRHPAQAVAVGNGTASREASAFVRDVLAKRSGSEVFCAHVSEAGASIYSASKLAREEFPDLDVTVRGAISIARRLQDPLAELVKIEPRHIGVGQYQHDLNQKRLREGLERTVVNCVNAVGVNANTASVALLRQVSGIQANTAENIVKFREAAGGLKSRKQLLDVDGIGERIYEQCAGFLRILEADDKLDATGIHPESYPVVERIADGLSQTPEQLIANDELLAQVDWKAHESEAVGPLALEDIRRELASPGRDPRSAFEAPHFLDGVNSLDDLSEGMELEGVVSNVTDFGAFVDVGVHQDGLVHLSELAHRYVSDPREVVKVGDIVRVKITGVDTDRKRVSMSIKALLPPPAGKARSKKRPASGDDRKQISARTSAKAGGRPKPERSRRKKPNRKGEATKKPAKKPDPKKESSGSINTLLADQLNDLKRKLGS